MEKYTPLQKRIALVVIGLIAMTSITLANITANSQLGLKHAQPYIAPTPTSTPEPPLPPVDYSLETA